MPRAGPELQLLRREAVRVRQVIEASERDDWMAGTLAVFPRQCCDHAMRLLALHLARLGFFDLRRAKGARSAPGTYPIYHIWLRWRDLNLDITADQFGEGLPPVLVSRRSRWHAAWRPTLEPIDESRMARWLSGDGGVIELYHEILEKLGHEPRRAHTDGAEPSGAVSPRRRT